jgi:hypothetical protein
MNISTLLARHGPMTTSKAAQFLQKSGISPAAARQRVSRRAAGIRTLHGLPFPKRARFIYLESQFGTDAYWAALIDAIATANPAYAAALAGLKARGKISLKRHFDIISGSPEKQKAQLASSVVLDRLVSAKLMSIVSIDGFGECVSLGQDSVQETARIASLRARLLTESVLLDAIRTWAGRMNMSSPKATKIRDEVPEPRFSTFRFDLTGPCYLRPMMRIEASSADPGFLVADVLLGQDLDETMVQAFLRKCTMLGSLRKIRPFLPMLIADTFTPEALRLCRQRGIIATHPETLFGQDVARALGDLLKTLTHAASAANDTPSRIESLFHRLSAIEGTAGNLRGALFELIVGHCVRSIEGGPIDIGLIVYDVEKGKRAEIDVRLVKETEVAVYECKGYQPSSVVSKAEIEKWITEKVPTIFSALRQENRFSNSIFRFEFWTCGTFDPEALVLMNRLSAATRRYQISWKEGKDIQQYSNRLSAPGIKKILDEHYFKHPLSAFKRSVERPQVSAIKH